MDTISIPGLLGIVDRGKENIIIPISDHYDYLAIEHCSVNANADILIDKKRGLKFSGSPIESGFVVKNLFFHHFSLALMGILNFEKINLYPKHIEIISDECWLVLPIYPKDTRNIGTITAKNGLKGYFKLLDSTNKNRNLVFEFLFNVSNILFTVFSKHSCYDITVGETEIIIWDRFLDKKEKMKVEEFKTLMTSEIDKVYQLLEDKFTISKPPQEQPIVKRKNDIGKEYEYDVAIKEVKDKLKKINWEMVNSLNKQTEILETYSKKEIIEFLHQCKAYPNSSCEKKGYVAYLLAYLGHVYLKKNKPNKKNFCEREEKEEFKRFVEKYIHKFPYNKRELSAQPESGEQVRLTRKRKIADDMPKNYEDSVQIVRDNLADIDWEKVNSRNGRWNNTYSVEELIGWLEKCEISVSYWEKKANVCYLLQILGYKYCKQGETNLVFLSKAEEAEALKFADRCIKKWNLNPEKYK